MTNEEAIRKQLAELQAFNELQAKKIAGMVKLLTPKKEKRSPLTKAQEATLLSNRHRTKYKRA